MAQQTQSNAKEYAHPEVLVSTDWVAEHLNDDGIRIVGFIGPTACFEHFIRVKRRLDRRSDAAYSLP